MTARAHPPLLPARLVTLAFSAYVVAAIGLHWVAGADHVWEVAALMMVLMTVTYPTEAALARQDRVLEFSIAGLLSALAIAGLFTSPLLIIAAVLAHGVLDLVKARGLGVPFYALYFFGCAAFDFAYAACLFAYFIRFGGLG
ncbi:MAG: hypothetical protein AAF092_11630 [Pseudomonadota bacterium]